MNSKKTNIQLITLAIFIIVAAMSRLLPHPPNMTPIAAMGLFGAAHFSKKYFAFLVPFIALLISDIVLCTAVYKMNMVEYLEASVFVYGAFAAVIGFGFLFLKKYNWSNLILASFAASLIFFVITNLGVWASGTMYPMTATGLVACFTAAIPFFLNSIIGNLFFTGVLFGAYELIDRKFFVPKIA